MNYSHGGHLTAGCSRTPNHNCPTSRGWRILEPVHYAGGGKLRTIVVFTHTPRSCYIDSEVVGAFNRAFPVLGFSFAAHLTLTPLQ